MRSCFFFQGTVIFNLSAKYYQIREWDSELIVVLETIYDIISLWW